MTAPWNPPAAFESSTAQEYLLALATFITKYQYLYQHKSISFFTCSVWDTIPSDWKLPLLDLDDHEAALFATGTLIKPGWPASLKEFLQDVQTLVMPRKEVMSFSFLPDSPSLSPSSTTPSPNNFSLPALARNMTQKKIHEVTKLSALIAGVAKQVESESVEVVDVGSGEGYLGQVLYHEYGLNVVGVDERSEFTEGAQQRAHFIRKECEARARRSANEATDTINNNSKPKNNQANKMSHEERLAARQADIAAYNVKNVVACITLDMDPTSFELIAWPNQSPTRAVLVGLHTCGVLANAMLRLFMLSSKMDALVDVGCCYYRKQPGTKYELMSDAAQQMAVSLPVYMSPGALKLACEATWLETKYPNGHNFNIRGLPRKKALSFTNYATLAVKRIAAQSSTSPTSSSFSSSPSSSSSSPSPSSSSSSPPSLSSLSISSNTNNETHINELEQLFEKLKDHNPHVNVSLLLRSVMSPVLESFILLDRFLYLQESGAVPYLVPLFDEALSPRNMAIIAFKSPNSCKNK